MGEPGTPIAHPTGIPGLLVCRLALDRHTAKLISTDMTAHEASQGTMECVLPEGGRVLVDLSGGVAGDPDVEADLVQVMLDAGGSDVEVCEAIVHYADATGLSARSFLGRQAVAVAVVEAGPRRG